MAKQRRFKDLLRVEQTITSRRNPAVQATIKQIHRKDKVCQIVFHGDRPKGDRQGHAKGDDTIIDFTTLKNHWTCDDWNVVYVPMTKD